MPEQRTCDYTGEEIEPGTGIMYVRRDGTVLHFKDSKAEKNFFMGREADELGWTGPEAAAGDAAETEETEAAEEGETTAEADAETEEAETTEAAEPETTDDAESEADPEVEAEPAEGERE